MSDEQKVRMWGAGITVPWSVVELVDKEIARLEDVLLDDRRDGNTAVQTKNHARDTMEALRNFVKAAKLQHGRS